jgi:hypothetical protein
VGGVSKKKERKKNEEKMPVGGKEKNILWKIE